MVWQTEKLDIGSRIKNAREMAGMSQSDLAARMAQEPSAISHWETGRRSPTCVNLRKLCRVLGCSADYIIGL